MLLSRAKYNLSTFPNVLSCTWISRFDKHCAHPAQRPFTIDLRRTPKYRHGLNCGHDLRRITSIVRSPAKDIIWLDSLYRFWVAAPCIRRVRAYVRTCVHACMHDAYVRAYVRACVLWVMAVRSVWVTLRTHCTLYTYIESFDLVTNRLEILS